MSQFHFTPDDYLTLMHSEVPAFDELQDRVARASNAISARRILELGTGTGETARRVLAVHPHAHLTGIDVSADMLAAARRALPRETSLLVQPMEDPLPEGPFDLVISALAVHHLDGPAKAELFERVARVLRDGGLFVMGDVVIPKDPDNALTPLSPSYDVPSTVEDLLGWLVGAGLDPRTEWSHRDLAVIGAAKSPAA